MRYDKNTFVEKAKEIYNNKYDYSKVVYVNQSTSVIIICPEHGDYVRTPSYHLRGGDCPVCAKMRSLAGCRKPMSEEAKEKRRQTNLKKYGATTFAGSHQAHELYKMGEGPWSKKARRKAAKTCEERFGAKTWAESDVGHETARERCSDTEYRKMMSERAKSDVARQHYVDTSIANCGSEHWTKTDDGKRKLHEMFSTDEERLLRSQRMLSPEVQEKIQKTSIERYGVPYYWQSDEGRKRLRMLLNNKDVQRKIIETKIKRGTINSSKPEKIAYSLLVKKFGENDVKVQYNQDDRYPFNCDFYIKSLDLFIELNISWLHGFHWFDATSSDDLLRLQELLVRADESKPMYERAVYIWTYDDLRKKYIAEQNHLNYIVFWDNDLKDFQNWLETISLL
jgi:hypothetical protein